MLFFFRRTYQFKTIFNFFFIFFLLSISQNIKAADKSLAFDGEDDFVTIANNSALNPTGAYTIGAWFKHEGHNTTPGKSNNFQSIITSRSQTTTERGYMMYLEQTTYKLTYWKGTSSTGSWVHSKSNEVSTWKENGAGSPGTPGWQYYIIRFNGVKTQDVFLNGVEVKSNTTTKVINVQNTDKPTRIGAGRTENETVWYHFKGKIDEVAVWDEALTDAEISALYNSGETLYAKQNYGDYTSSDNLTAYYTMDSDDGTGTTLSDDEGSNDGSFSGAPSWSTDVPGNLPTLSSSNPSDNATDIAYDTNIVLTFSEIVRVGTGNIVLHKASDDSVVETFDVTTDVSGSETTEININLSSDLEKEAEYYVNIASTAIVDLSNNSYAGISDSTTLNFTTGARPTNPLEDKDVIGIIETQTEAPKKVIQHVSTPIYNRLNWIRGYQTNEKQDAQRIKFKFLNPKISKIANIVPETINFNKIPNRSIDDWLFWSEGSVSVGKVGDTTNSSSKDVNTNAVTLGWDRKIDDETIHGYTVTYTQDDVEVGSSGTSVDIDSYSFSTYATFNRSENQYIEGILGVSKLDFKNIRKSGSNTLTGNRIGKQVFGSIQYINSVNGDKIDISPNIRLDLSSTSLSQYSETGTNALYYGKQTVETVGLYSGLTFNNELLKNDFILRPSAGFELGIDLSPSSDVNLNYVSDPNTKYTKSIDQHGEKSIKGKIGFDVLHNNGWSLMTFYERNQSENSHSDTLYFLTGYVSSKEEEYAMALNDKKASIEYKRNVNGFDISFDTAYDLFAENSGYEINLKISSIF